MSRQGMTKKQRTAVLKDRDVYYYCRETIGGEYFNVIGKMHDRVQAAELAHGPDEEKIIVRYSDRRWIVTAKISDEDDIKSIRAECTNLTNAKEMIA